MTMSPGLRRITLTAHLSVSLSWIGALAAYTALDIAAATGRQALTLRAAYLGMDLIVRFVIVPFAFASLLTGLAVALGSRWGLFRHYWVLISFLLATFVSVVMLRTARIISSFADIAGDPATSGSDLRALGNTLIYSVGGIVVLIAIRTLMEYKPLGMTPYGHRKKRERRAVGVP